MIGGTLTLFLVLQNIGLPESNYVQIALFEWFCLGQWASIQ
jgi:hypothetical protein